MRLLVIAATSVLLLLLLLLLLWLLHLLLPYYYCYYCYYYTAGIPTAITASFAFINSTVMFKWEFKLESSSTMDIDNRACDAGEHDAVKKLAKVAKKLQKQN